MIWRVRDRETFRKLARGRRHRRGPVTVVRVRLPEAEQHGDPARVAYRVGRRVGNAVTRNRVRRRLRAAVTTHAELLVPGSAYLVTGEPGARDAAYGDLDEAVAGLLGDLREAS